MSSSPTSADEPSRRDEARCPTAVDMVRPAVAFALVSTQHFATG